MKPNEVVMLVDAYDGVIDPDLMDITFPADIPEWVVTILRDEDSMQMLKENESGEYHCRYWDMEKLSNEKLPVRHDIFLDRYMIPETIVEYTSEEEYISFMERFASHYLPSGEDSLLALHGADDAQLRYFSILIFIMQWAGKRYKMYDDFTIFECREKESPYDDTIITIQRMIGSVHGIVLTTVDWCFFDALTIRINHANILTLLQRWLIHSKNYRENFVYFVKHPENFSNKIEDGKMIHDMVHGYLVKSHWYDKLDRNAEDEFLTPVLALFSEGRYRYFTKHKETIGITKYYKYIPTTLVHSVMSSYSCFEELRLLVNRSNHWFIDTDGCITTTEVTFVDTAKDVIRKNPTAAVDYIHGIAKENLTTQPISLISNILDIQETMWKDEMENNEISYNDPVGDIDEVDIVMYFAKYYIENSLNNKTAFLEWWNHVSYGTHFSNGEICRNLDVLSDFFSEDPKIVKKSGNSEISNKIWNIAMYGIYMFTLRATMNKEIWRSNNGDKIKLMWVRYASLSRIQEISNFPWKKEKSSNPLVGIASDKEQKDGLSFILAAAALNIDLYSIYPAYQYLVKTMTPHMCTDGFDLINRCKSADFVEIYQILRTSLQCNIVPVSIYRLAILSLRKLLSKKADKMEEDPQTYKACIRMLDNRLLSYTESNTLTDEYYAENVINSSVALKITNYIMMDNLKSQIEKSINYLNQEQIFENWNRIMLTKTMVDREGIKTFNEHMIEFLVRLQ